MPGHLKTSRKFDYVLIGSFLLAISFPVLVTLVGGTRESSRLEKRTLVQLPDWQWNYEAIGRYPNAFEKFYKDQFGLRDQLVHWHNLLKIRLGVSPTKKVIVGKHGWLFYAEGKIIDDYIHGNLLTTTQLERFRTNLEKKYKWLQDRKIFYVFVIAPNKGSIYSEYLPSWIQKRQRMSMHDQIIEYMSTHSEVPILDLRPVLLQAKETGILYEKTGTHWNRIGANFAQYEIGKYLSLIYPEIQAKLYSVSNFRHKTRPGTDLAGLMNLRDELTENAPYLAAKLPACNRRDVARQPYHPKVNPAGKMPVFTTDCRNGTRLDVVIFRDSFFSQLQLYISQYFRKTTYVWGKPDIGSLKQFVEAMEPDLVIEERVERNLRF